MLKRILPWIFIISGCIVIAIALYQRFETVLNQNELIKQYENNFEQTNERIENPPKSSSEDFNSDSNKTALPTVIDNPDENNSKKPTEKKIPMIIGILKIPKINLRVAIGEGSENDSMRYTVGHFSNTAKPGSVGNFAVIGHRNYRYGQFFNRLDELEKGDLLEVKRGLHTFTYKVTESLIVKPEDTWVLDNTGNASITLITCTPIRVATHRLVVKGILEKTD